MPQGAGGQQQCNSVVFNCYQPPHASGPCPSSQPNAMVPANAHDSSQKITNWNKAASPAGSVTVTTPSGTTFQAPNYANFQAAYASGAKDGPNPFALDSDFGHGGTYDYQRVGNTFISAYTYASNYAVGIGINGAGIPQWAMVPLLRNA